MDNSTIVCKCEEISISEIETAIKIGAEQLDDIKRLTRCGMGPCQSKICMNLVREVISSITGKPLAEIGYSKTRMPLKVTRLGALVGDGKQSKVLSVFEESMAEVESQ